MLCFTIIRAFMNLMPFCLAQTAMQMQKKNDVLKVLKSYQTRRPGLNTAN